MKVEQAGDLIFLTYFMVKWDEEEQSPSGDRCSQCGNEMKRVQAEVGAEGLGYEGLVCHDCRRVTWLRAR